MHVSAKPRLTLLVAAVAALADRAAVAQEPAGSFVIPPGQEVLTLRMIGADADLPSACTVTGAAIEASRILARYRCPSGPVQLELRHRAAVSNRPTLAVTRHFAVTTLEPERLSTELVAAVVARIQAEEGAWRWQDLTQRPNAVNARSPAQPMPAEAVRDDPVRWPWLLALAMTFGPVAVGAAAGWLVAASKRRRWWLAGLLAALGVVPLLVALHDPTLGLHDLAWLAGFTALGAAGGYLAQRGAIPRRRAALAAAVALVGLAVLELALRAVPIAGADTAPTESARLLFPREEREFGFRAFFPERFGNQGFARAGETPLPSARAGVRRYLHVGDSMVASLDVPAPERFTALLERALPGTQHLNLGVISVGPDASLVLLRRWIDRLAPDAVVLHLTPSNDMADLGRAYAFCDAGPLLDFARPGLPERCLEPNWRFSLRMLVAQGPHAYPLRVASPHLRTVHLLRRILYRWLPDTGVATPPDWNALRRVVRAVADLTAARRVPLTVVVLPSRVAIEGTDANPAYHRDVYRHMLAMAAAERLRVIDAWAPFEAAQRQDPAAKLYVEPESNPHFAPEGQRLITAVLAPHLAR